MAGISHVLSIAKEALLAHQLSVQVASNNIANVDTPGYTRQALLLQPNQATPIAAGSLGGGVRGQEIFRYYDQFMTQRLVTQQSILGNLDAQQQSMRVVETVFNEAPGLALNDLMSQFWGSWQDLADNPEILATRQSVVQAGLLLQDQLQTMNAEITRAKQDIGVNLDTAIQDVNSLTSQIAALNVQITTEESPEHQANDLRDQRDTLLKNLSELVDVTYFENNQGSYTVLLADGHSLVETNESWTVQWSNNKLYWLNSNSGNAQTRQEIGTGADLGGKIGGWLEIRGDMLEGDPDNFLGRLDALANALIREVNQQHSQGVGTVRFSDAVLGTEIAANAARLTSPVDSATATTTIPANTIQINGRAVGEIVGGVTTDTGGLAMRKAANTVTAINNAISGVTAKLTTLTAGSAVTAFAPGDDGQTFNFTVNGVTVSYTVDVNGTAPDDDNPATLANNIVNAINTAISNYNSPGAPALDPKPPLTIEAVAGDGFNGGALNSIVLRNINEGDESRIIIDGIAADATGLAANLGLTDGTYTADGTHNTGKITLFSDAPFTVEAGVNDTVLDQLGLAGGTQTTSFTGNAVSAEPGDAANTQVSFDLNGQNINVTVTDGSTALQTANAMVAAVTAVMGTTGVQAQYLNGALVFSNATAGDNSIIKVTNFTTLSGTGTIFGFGNFTAEAGGISGDIADDGRFTYTYSNGGVSASLQGYKYADELQTDGTGFDIWLYNTDGSLALPQAVNVSLERAYTLNDVADAINYSIMNASGASSPWVNATVVDNTLKLTPDASHSFAFANDTTNFLQVAGVNTFFKGDSAGSIAVNEAVAKDLDTLAAGTVTSKGEIFKGDNTNALLVSNIQQKEDVAFTGGRSDSLDGFYNALVGEVGNQGRTINRSLEFNTLVTNQMEELRDSTSGVSLDEEMANLVKYQHAYSAAARLISMSDEMLLTLLDSVK